MLGRRTRWLSFGLAGVALAGCSAGAARPAAHTAAPTPKAPTPTPNTDATAAPPLTLGQIGQRTDVPWQEVGVGWSLALTTASTSANAKEDLVLVDPDGGAYDITPLDIDDTWYLVDRSGDGRRALLEPRQSAHGPTPAIEVDLRSGLERHFTLPDGTVAIGYTKPNGDALLATASSPADDGPNTLERLDLSGHLQRVFDRNASTAAVMTPDGTALVIAHMSAQSLSQSRLRLVGNDGRLIRVLPMPTGAESCDPVRWEPRQEVLAECRSDASPIARLWLVPTGGAGTPTPLTHRRDDKGPDYGDINAWRLRDGSVYLTALGACGGVIIAKDDARGNAVQVFVPHQRDRNDILGIDARQRFLVDSSGEGGGGGCTENDTFVWFDPAARTTAPYVRKLPGGGHVIAAMMWASADDVN